MKKYLIILFSFIASSGILVTANAQTKMKIKGEEITYKSGDLALKGYVAFNPAQKGKRPVIIVIPEWWGCNEYVRMRARKLAELGYIAIAADMYGEGKIAENPKEAQEYATPFYKDAELARSRIEAAINKINEYPEADSKKMAAIGYCFGGSMVLNAAKLGMDFKGVVSFHGGLAGAPAKEGLTKADILVCHGAADKFISEEEVKTFRNNLDEVKASYKFISYPGATHAFTNPDATINGKKFNLPIAYNPAADKKSWADMKLFFGKIFK